MLRFLALTAVALCRVYVVALTGFVLLRGLPSDAPWWLDLANTFTLYLFIPASLVLLLGLFPVSRSMMLMGALPAVLFLFLYGELFLPGQATSAATGQTFTIMTHNVYGANPEPRSVATVIEQTDADVVVLQELTIAIAGVLAPRLSSKYPYQALVPRGDFSGAGILSRFPFEMKEASFIGHLAQHVVLDLGGQQVHLFNAHPFTPEIQLTGRRPIPPYIIRGFDTDLQTEQVAALMERVAKVEGPVVLAGDFNITDQSRQYGQISRRLTDVYREAGSGFGHTFPGHGRFWWLPAAPLFRIDYIFHSAELEGIEARTGEPTGSDHLPVVAKLRFKNPKRP